MKNGANGINFSFFLNAHIAPKMHAATKAIASPVGPHHNPPTAISFISPIPIGVSAFGLRRNNILSNTSPTTAASMYPNVIPTTPVLMLIGHGKKLITKAPIINNGNKYASGIIRRFMSVFAIFQPRYSAVRIKIAKKAQNIYKNIFSSLRFESVL